LELKSLLVGQIQNVTRSTAVIEQISWIFISASAVKDNQGATFQQEHIQFNRVRSHVGALLKAFLCVFQFLINATTMADNPWSLVIT
jgi:hypothetical protein